jgi:type I restriction enzyme, S subunit
MNLKGVSHGFPAKWQIKNLGEICNISTGKLNANAASENGKYPFFTCSREIFSIDHFNFDCEAILLAGNNAVGDFNVKHYKGKFNAYQRTYVITINKGESLLYKYLYLQVENALKGFKIKSVGAGTKFLKLDMIKNLEIHIPPLPEQKRIVAILDEAFEGIDRAITNTEKNLTNASELFESYLQNLDAEKESLGNLVDIRTGKLDANAATEDGQYPFFTCSREIYKIDNFAFDCEAILLAGNNAVGDFNVKHYKGKFNAYQRTYVITINGENRTLYRYLYFQMLKSLKDFKAQSVGAGTKFLKLGMIKELQMALPTIEKQQEIISILDKLEAETQRLEAIYRQKIAALNELKQSILQKAFTGELTSDHHQATEAAEEEIAA